MANDSGHISLKECLSLLSAGISLDFKRFLSDPKDPPNHASTANSLMIIKLTFGLAFQKQNQREKGHSPALLVSK